MVSHGDICSGDPASLVPPPRTALPLELFLPVDHLGLLTLLLHPVPELVVILQWLPNALIVHVRVSIARQLVLLPTSLQLRLRFAVHLLHRLV